MYRFIVSAVTALALGALWTPGASGQGCGCPAAAPVSSHTLLICPAGDGPTLEEIGAVITLQYDEVANTAYAWSPGGCAAGIEWCGSRPESESAGSDSEIMVSGAFAGGGYATEFVWIIATFYLPVCWEQWAPVTLVSPDLNADLVVNLIDFSRFALGYPTAVEPNKPYDPRIDYNGDGTIGLVDFYLFALHMEHRCS